MVFCSDSYQRSRSSFQIGIVKKLSPLIRDWGQLPDNSHLQAQFFEYFPLQAVTGCFIFFNLAPRKFPLQWHFHGRTALRSQHVAISFYNCTCDVDMRHDLIACLDGRRIHFVLLIWCRLIAGVFKVMRANWQLDTLLAVRTPIG